MLSSTSGVRGGSHASGSSVDDSCGHGHGHGQGHGRRVRIALDTVTEVTEVPVGADGEAEWPNAVRRAAAAARGLAEGVWLSPYAGPRPADGADDSETSFNFLCVKVPAIGSDIAVAAAGLSLTSDAKGARIVASLGALAVREPMQRCGVGSAFVEEIHDWLRLPTVGAKYVFVSFSREPRARASLIERFFRRAGYKLVCEADDDDRVDLAVLMRLADVDWRGRTLAHMMCRLAR